MNEFQYLGRLSDRLEKAEAALREYVEAHDAWDPAGNLHGRDADQIAKEQRLLLARQRAREVIASPQGDSTNV
jgi:hypothetical protein